MTKFQTFLNSINSTLNNLNVVEVKSTLGDSTSNNRILSVNQLIRFLESSGVRGHKTLANNLQTVYSTVRPIMRENRDFCSRTDAFDTTELLNTLQFVDSSVVRSIGRRLV